MRYPKEEIENYRQNAGELENELIDEFNTGEMSRGDLFRRGSVLGMSLPLLGLVSGVPLAAAAPAVPSRASAGTLRIGHTVSTARSSRRAPVHSARSACRTCRRAAPVRRQERGSASAARDHGTPSRNARTWNSTCAGTSAPQTASGMTADDVVATFRSCSGQLAGASGLQGHPATRAEGRRLTVAFDMVNPNGLFPYLLAADGVPGS